MNDKQQPTREEDLSALLPALARSFAVEDLPAAPEVDEALLLQWLTERIGVLIERQPALLLHILYRVDVAEKQVQAAMQHAAPGRLAAVLAEEVLARLKEKLIYRRRYASERAEAAPEQPPED